MKITRLTKASDKDAFLLSTIAYEAKAFWGYPQDWLDMWQDDLTLHANGLNGHFTFVLKLDGEIKGFCLITSEADRFEIDHCWVHPEHIGKGYGSQLLAHVLSLDTFRDKEFHVLSDPNATGFYQKFGFETVKMVPGKPAGRSLPLMRMVNNAH